MAQLVERLVRNEKASGSNPLISTKYKNAPVTDAFFYISSSNLFSKNFVTS